MSNRTRNIQKKIFINEEEGKLIKQKMDQLGTNNFGAYARKLLVDGYIIKKDQSGMKNIAKEINKIGVNINQIAKRSNETNRIYAEDIEVIKSEMKEIWQLLKSNQ